MGECVCQGFCYISSLLQWCQSLFRLFTVHFTVLYVHIDIFFSILNRIQKNSLKRWVIFFFSLSYLVVRTFCSMATLFFILNVQKGRSHVEMRRKKRFPHKRRQWIESEKGMINHFDCKSNKAFNFVIFFSVRISRKIGRLFLAISMFSR